jgi:predicted outer membrane repeat protein
MRRMNTRRLRLTPLEDRSIPATIPVTSPAGDGATGTLGWAIAIANANPGEDTIQFDQTPDGGFGGFAVPQKIDLVTALPNVTDDLTIQGPGRGKLTLDGQNATGGFMVFKGFSLSGLTIANAFDALYVRGGAASPDAVTVTDCTFRNNSAYKGGAIFGQWCNLKVTDTDFDHNRATSDPASTGGAINLVAGALEVTNCTFTGNSAVCGGAINTIAGLLTVKQSTFSGNTATLHGGAIANLFYDGGFSIWTTSAAAELNVNSSTFTGNSAVEDGGAVYWGTGDWHSFSGRLNATVVNATLSNNAARRGGAMAVIDTTLVANGNTYTGNTGYSDGGAMIIDPSEVTIISCTFAGNTAPVGADLSAVDSTVTLVGTTVGGLAAAGGSVTATDLFTYQGGMIDQLEVRVAALGLTAGQQNSLRASLEAARQSLASGNGAAAVGQLGAFVNKVNALVNSHRLGEITADALISQVDSLVDTI